MVIVEREVIFDMDLWLTLPEIPEVVQVEGKTVTVNPNDQPTTSQAKEQPTIPQAKTPTIPVPPPTPAPTLSTPQHSTQFAPHQPGHYHAINEGKKAAMAAIPDHSPLHPNSGEEPMMAFLSSLGTEPRWSDN